MISFMFCIRENHLCDTVGLLSAIPCDVVSDVVGYAPHILDNVTRLQSALANIMEPDFGLLEELLRLDVLNRRQLAKVRSGDKTVYERNDTLLDLLETEDHCDKLLIALQRTGQQHVVNFITENGGMRH